MRSLIKLAAVAALAVLGPVATAQAQSMVAPMVTSNMYQPTSSAWDGFYLGAQGSLIGMKSHESAPGILPPPEQLLGDIGGSAGVFAGYRYQLTDWFVLGVDAEVNNVATQFEYSGLNYGALKWDAAVRATLGYPVAPNVLAYGTVGYSWGRFDLSPSRGVTTEFTAGGFQLGLGVDMMVTQNIIARLNATWTHYGVNNVPGGGTSEPSNQVVRAGLAWKF
ncbi:porin family protein [Devosia oryziradicis]|uniref:Porin family protein n=1 Tax=Devosia oryziradicis TaxID=2801335 RepID=A0ABX7C2C5_9HYPH|nr:outer membrane beta-barrel protein [Devosia oryziradicis]QQR36161.1 porin family protein [Devosia oryziradicis]